MFLRISQFFENNLDTEKWHRDLLHKMRIEIVDLSTLPTRVPRARWWSPGGTSRR